MPKPQVLWQPQALRSASQFFGVPASSSDAHLVFLETCLFLPGTVSLRPGGTGAGHPLAHIWLAPLLTTVHHWDIWLLYTDAGLLLDHHRETSPATSHGVPPLPSPNTSSITSCHDMKDSQAHTLCTDITKSLLHIRQSVWYQN